MKHSKLSILGSLGSFILIASSSLMSAHETAPGAIAAGNTHCQIAKIPASAPQRRLLIDYAPLVVLFRPPGEDEAGRDLTYRFLNGCNGEVVVAEKDENTGAPQNCMKRIEAQAGGGRTGLVMSGNVGERSILARLAGDGGVAKTKEYLLTKLEEGYDADGNRKGWDFILIDEITALQPGEAAPLVNGLPIDWDDTSEVNFRFRQLLEEPELHNKIIPYVSVGLMEQQPPGRLFERGRLLAALNCHARAIALEVYLTTREVMKEPSSTVDTRLAFKAAAKRLKDAVAGLSGGQDINKRAITVVATTKQADNPKYIYLNSSGDDLRSIWRQALALRSTRSGRDVRLQRGVGYYYNVGSEDLAAVSGPDGYTKTQLVAKMSRAALYTLAHRGALDRAIAMVRPVKPPGPGPRGDEARR